LEKRRRSGIGSERLEYKKATIQIMNRLFFTCFLVPLFLSNGLAAPLRKELNEAWKFKQVRGYNWYPATVPGVVHTDLLDNGLIEDPFFRLNERGLQWIDKEDWLYETVFDLDDLLLQKENIHIRFDGLDTYADVTLNGEKILSANNMFREWDTDVKALLKEKDNQLQVYFHSPIKIAMPQWEALPFQYRSSNDQSENGGLFNRKVGVFVRKAGYHFGWDWGPRLVTSGIWRPVYLEAWNDARIENVHYKQTSVTEKEAVIDVVVEITADKNRDDVSVSILNRTDKRLESNAKVRLLKGLNKIPLTFKIKRPRLWWTNGLGESFLYDFSTQINSGRDRIDSREQKLGIRSVKVITRADESGESFYFELNGKPLFAKGANYIPCDNFLPRVTDSIYEKTVRDAVDANMNMLRVWGGGIYENDVFYDLCDKYGILVWQDFMFACSLFPAEGDFLENIRLEAIDNVRRLRNHPCIALWCGNNECLDAWFNWHWKEAYDKGDPTYSEIIRKQFKEQYFVALPEVVEEYHPGACYRKSSPYSDDNGTRNPTVGDMHYWEVWQGLKPLSAFLDERSRFFSEYGFQSFPELASIKKYASQPGDWEITSEVMMAHQRGGMAANTRINNFLLEEYRQPKDFSSFVYMSQLLQADAIKMAMEAHRRDKPYCMGSLVWQHNDCWPVASWSSRDYYGRWKAQHYFTVKSFADLLVSPVEKEGKLQIYMVSDRLEETSGTLSIQLIHLNKGLIHQQEMKISLPANTSIPVWTTQTETLLGGLSREEVVLHLKYKDKNGSSYGNNFFFAKQKDMNYPEAQINHTLAPVENGFELTLTSHVFARGVFISLNGKDHFITDNYMDLIPGEEVKVKILTDLPISSVEANLNIRSFANTSSDE
jgi:beta-mannosidase